ncbi:MAG: ABC transporter permease [Actinomycetota bacterium]|jgi:peptide/nickel transport system permease protein|nr:ABC transporter permease [Actinomycetota bacterium]MDA8183462.1 ABC transporter permease [Actinomycetota bacterium]
MIGYLIRRVIQAVIVVLGVVVIVFLLSRLIPGGEAHAVLGPKATPALVREFNHANGFTQPLWVQFWHYLIGLPLLHLGYSYKYTEPVWDVISTRLPKTLVLVGTSTLLALAVAVPLGVLQVVRKNKPSDYALTGLAFVLYSMPSFFLGTLLIEWFAFDARLLPVSPPSNASPFAVWTDPKGFILPVLTLAAITVAGFSRYMRSSLLDAMAEDYIRTARAKGASGRRVLYGHALRNALIPIITLIGLSLPGIVSGAVIVEDLFNYPGMGLLTVQAAENADIPTVLGTTLVITVATVVGSLVADILYVLVDPRIRYGGTF